MTFKDLLKIIVCFQCKQSLISNYDITHCHCNKSFFYSDPAYELIFALINQTDYLHVVYLINTDINIISLCINKTFHELYRDKNIPDFILSSEFLEKIQILHTFS